ncbi:hypothetical protein OJ996_08970 [Luteolibacter sp. GHJ8]|uniref:DDE family transposase n=1 Tax=Luteolibacter rhizosphaerae TaxID=2989719 RepID=A0ABT3G2A8_9BACT|nr:hypothetical protein [Luteolibacter rhizosphaerae]MCW1913704.1 hypothetical protein [Luteolibacter rhizosphaerae]
MWVIPDHYQRDARRWKIAERNGKLVRTRSEFAIKIRNLRAKGMKIDRQYSLLANMVLFCLQLEIGEFRKSKRRKDRKAVPA